MRTPREAVSTALLSMFTGNPALMALLPGGVMRRPQMWVDIDDNQKPCLLLFKGGPATETYVQSNSGLTKYVILYNLWLYLTASSDLNVPAETVMNNIADQIDASFDTELPTVARKSAFGERQTLGGLVTNAYLDAGSEWAREFQDGNIVAMWRILVETGI
jgi:hypothetical protein